MAVMAIVGLPAVSSAEIYTWVDSSGVVTYSNLSPPKDAKVTDVVHETPLTPQDLADAAHRSEVSALNDRIRLLELEMARSKRELVDYPGAPPAPPGGGCGPDGYSDCNPQWSPYYTTGLLYGSTGRWHTDMHASTRGHGYPWHHTPAGSARITHVASGPHAGARTGH
jgi:hypothetical protein